MALDLNSLRKAVGSLARAVNVAATMIQGTVDTDQEQVVRAGVIQNFEFTYELCWKFIKRWLEANSGGSAVDGLTMKELFRLAAESHLIKDVQAWFEYHRKRNQTAHTYDENTAEAVYETAVRFVTDAQDLLQALEARND